MYGIYLKCDRCGKTIGGEEVTEQLQGIPPLNRFEGQKLRDLAAARGWVHTPSDTDTCPTCAMFFEAALKPIDTNTKNVP